MNVELRSKRDSVEDPSSGARKLDLVWNYVLLLEEYVCMFVCMAKNRARLSEMCFPLIKPHQPIRLAPTRLDRTMNRRIVMVVGSFPGKLHHRNATRIRQRQGQMFRRGIQQVRRHRPEAIGSTKVRIGVPGCAVEGLRFGDRGVFDELS